MAGVSRENFGPNTWLVEELYRQYQEDPGSVSDVWQEFFEDYEPTADGQTGRAEPDAEAVTRLGEAAEEVIEKDPTEGSEEGEAEQGNREPETEEQPSQEKRRR